MRKARPRKFPKFQYFAGVDCIICIKTSRLTYTVPFARLPLPPLLPLPLPPLPLPPLPLPPLPLPPLPLPPLHPLHPLHPFPHHCRPHHRRTEGMW